MVDKRVCLQFVCNNHLRPLMRTMSHDVRSLPCGGFSLYKMDASGRVACGFGKTSLGDEKLTDNLTAFLQSVETNRLSPQGKFILACRVSSAQTRTSFLLDLNQFQLTP